jgi:hypothetical protein
VAGRKKRPRHMSIYARMNIFGTSTILHGTHLTTDVSITTQSNMSNSRYSNRTPSFKELSIAFWAASKTYHGVKGSQYAVPLDDFLPICSRLNWYGIPGISPNTSDFHAVPLSFSAMAQIYFIAISALRSASNSR